MTRKTGGRKWLSESIAFSQQPLLGVLAACESNAKGRDGISADVSGIQKVKLFRDVESVAIRGFEKLRWKLAGWRAVGDKVGWVVVVAEPFPFPW